jgi:hypothetical protein
MCVGVPPVISYNVVCKVGSHFTNIAPLAGVRSTSKGQTQGNQHKDSNRNHGLNGGSCLLMESAVSGLPVDLDL